MNTLELRRVTEKIAASGVEHTAEGQARIDKLRALRRRGIHVPREALRDVDRDIPGHAVRDWGWYAECWPRPTVWNASDLSEFDLNRAQTNWDTSSTFVTGQADASADLEQRRDAQRVEQMATQTEREAAWQAAEAERERRREMPRVLPARRYWD